jgi:tight adherence protein C
MPFTVGLLAALSVVSLVAASATRMERQVLTLFHPSPGGRARPLVARVVARMSGWKSLRRVARADRLAVTVEAAGLDVDVADVVAAKCGAALGVVLVVLALAPAMLPLAVIAGTGAFAVPDVLVGRRAKRRRRMADLEVPQFLDLLAAASSAGLSAPAAIKRAALGVRGPLGEELATATASVEVGGRWRDELQRIADRLVLPDLHAAVVVVARTETLGSSLAESLQELATEVRESRRVRASERARTAPVKMLFPLVFMVLPAFLLLTVVPVLIATIRSLR